MADFAMRYRRCVRWSTASMKSAMTGRDAFGRLDEFDARPIDHDFLIDVADAAVRDSSLDDDRAVAEGEAEFVKGIELKGKAGFDLGAAAADLLDRHRLEDHDFAVELAEDLDALACRACRSAAHPARL